MTVACDVESAFLDAARIYGPQKGASDAQVALLTRRLKLVADQYRTRTGVDVTAITGGGAAGGLAGGLAAIGAQIVPGFEAVAESVGLEAAFEGATLVVTGEGKLDVSSLEGKVVGGVLGVVRRSRRPSRRGDRRPGHRRRRATRSPIAPTWKCSPSPTACGKPARPSPAPRSSWRKPQ